MKLKNNRGEIATLLTLVSVGLMLMGVVVGKFAVSKTTQTQSKACVPSEDNPTLCLRIQPTTETEPPTPVAEPPTEVPLDAAKPTAESSTIPLEGPTAEPTNTVQKKKVKCNSCEGNSCVYHEPSDPQHEECSGEGCVSDEECKPRSGPEPCNVCTTTHQCVRSNSATANCEGGCSGPSDCGGERTECGWRDCNSDGQWCGNDGRRYPEEDVRCKSEYRNVTQPPCNWGEGCNPAGQWCGNDGRRYPWLDARCKATPAPTGFCSQYNKCVGANWCRGDGRWGDSYESQINGCRTSNYNPSPTSIQNTASTPGWRAPCTWRDCNSDGQWCGNDGRRYPEEDVRCKSEYRNVTQPPCNWGEGCNPAGQWCGNDGRRYPWLDARCKATPAPTGFCSPLSTCIGQNWCRNDGRWGDSYDSEIYGCRKKPTSLTPTPKITEIPTPTPIVLYGKLPPYKNASAQDWAAVQNLAVNGKNIDSGQIKTWVYEAAKYYYPGMKTKSCDPTKGECDFRL